MQHMPTNAELSEVKRHSIPAHFMDTAIYWGVRLAKLMPRADDECVASLSFEDEAEVSDDDREEYCRDVAAVRMLANWEEAGIRTHVDAGLPTAQQAADTLTQKRRRRNRSTVERPSAMTIDLFDPYSGYVIDVDTDSLWCRVVTFAVEHFASSAANLFQTDIPIERDNDDVFVDEFAELLWRHRHDFPAGGEISLESSE